MLFYRGYGNFLLRFTYSMTLKCDCCADWHFYCLWEWGNSSGCTCIRHLANQWCRLTYLEIIGILTCLINEWAFNLPSPTAVDAVTQKSYFWFSIRFLASKVQGNPFSSTRTMLPIIESKESKAEHKRRKFWEGANKKRRNMRVRGFIWPFQGCFIGLFII